MSNAFGTIPQSPALGEASPDSLAELFARDPSGYAEQDWTRVITEMRAQRKRWQEAEASGRRPSAARAPKAKPVQVEVASAADLGLD